MERRRRGRGNEAASLLSASLRLAGLSQINKPSFRLLSRARLRKKRKNERRERRKKDFTPFAEKRRKNCLYYHPVSTGCLSECKSCILNYSCAYP